VFGRASRPDRKFHVASERFGTYGPLSLTAISSQRGLIFHRAEISISLKAGHTQIASIGLRRQVRTYPSHSSILYTLHPKCTGCEYPNDTFQVKYVWSNTCSRAKQEGVNRRSKSKMLEQSGADRNNGNKNRKRCDIITLTFVAQ
jgi:hypothetical protein